MTLFDKLIADLKLILPTDYASLLDDLNLKNGADLSLEGLDDDVRAVLIGVAKERTDDPQFMTRLAAYRVLGLFDADDRFGIGVDGDGLPEFDWVDIIAGKFLYGDGKKSHMLKNPFRISRYPVTYKQFQAFIDASDGFHDPRWWDGLADNAYRRKNQSVPDEQTFKFWNHPRENVSWYDSIAFCRWLSYKLGGKWGLDEVEQWAVRLPTEFEWERAARGTDGRKYTYEGKFDVTKGNTEETGIGQTSAVGMFTDGASPDDVLDMSGNLWEWCLTDYYNPAPDAKAEDLYTDVHRVARGGSWYHIIVGVTYRTQNFPHFRYHFSGFRVVSVTSGF